MSNIVNLLLSFIGGLIASLAAVIVWEKYRQPKLCIELSKEGPAIQTLSDGTRRAFYKLLVKNLGKSPAYYCKVFMHFFDEKGIKLVIDDVINGKWDRGPEPVINIPVPIKVDSGGGLILKTLEAQQSFLIPFSEALDIHQDVPAEAFCPVMKYESEQECYAFSALGYLIGKAPGHKVPGWKIGSGKFVIEIELVYSGKKSQKERFQLENNSMAADGMKIRKLEHSKLKKLWTRYIQLPFIIAVVINVVLITYLVTIFDSVTQITKAGFISQSIAATIALLVSFLESQKNWINLALTIAIELFIAGLFFQAIDMGLTR